MAPMVEYIAASAAVVVVTAAGVIRVRQNLRDLQKIRRELPDEPDLRISQWLDLPRSVSPRRPDATDQRPPVQPRDRQPSE